jgi:nucleotide-binding universal stress UspA family protein
MFQEAAMSTARTEIVVGLDRSAAAAAAVRWAADQARSSGAALRLIHVWQLSAVSAAAVAGGAGDLWAAGDADARAQATQWAQAALADCADLRWTLELVEGAPGPVLVARSRDAGLLVLGAREHRRLHRALHGSASHYCLSHARPTVVAVPALAAGAHTNDEASDQPAAAATRPTATLRTT